MRNSQSAGSFEKTNMGYPWNKPAPEEKGLLSNVASIKSKFGLSVKERSTFSKYSDDIEEGTPQRWCPEDEAKVYSMLLFSFADGLVKKGNKKHLDMEDLWDVSQRDTAKKVADRFQRNLFASRDDLKGAPQGRLGLAMWRTHGKRFMAAGVVKLFYDIVQFTSPVILEALLHNMASGGGRGISTALSFAMLGSGLLQTLMVNQYFNMLLRMGMHLKIGLVDTIYCKALRITSSVKSERGVGAITNLQSNDANKIWGMPQYMHVIWNGPFQILVIMGLLVRLMHWLPALAGMGVTVLLIPLSTILGKKLVTARKEMIKQTDARVKLCTEVITGIKAIKLYSWERPYVERISELREKELKAIRKTQIYSAINSVMFSIGPVLVSLAAFITYFALGYQLTAAVAFPALALFNMLRFPIIMLPSQITSLINARVGLQRIQKFIEAEERFANAQHGGRNEPPPAAIAISITNGHFCWELGKELVLKEVNLDIKRGKLVVVVGQVGSGKSSLLGAMLGEMYRKNGSVHVMGSVAYTAQDPWIQNSTLRANILMNQDINSERYTSVLTACALATDLEMLPAGDASEIGEKGINLSGGQKHRVALARACYADADIYLLDDPLSAVDAHVGRHLFDCCICGLLKDKTRVLVTHQLQYLPKADIVVVMSEGKITDVGPYEQLVARGVDFHKYATATEEEEVVEEAGKEIAVPISKDAVTSSQDKAESRAAQASAAAAAPSSKEACTDKPSSKEGASKEDGRGRMSMERAKLKETLSKKESEGKLVKVEERSKGSVNKAVYKQYLACWSPNYILPLLLIVWMFVERGLQVFQNFVLSYWSNASTVALLKKQPFNAVPYMEVYFILGILSILFSGLRSGIVITGSINSSRKLHRQLLSKVVRLPMSFFDSQPTGRLINRFTRDTESVDTNIASSITSTLLMMVNVLLSIVVITFVTPLTLAALIPLCYVYYRVQKIYITVSRELKRLDSVSNSPIFTHFSESLHGLQTIRAFKQEYAFIDKNLANLDYSNRAYWPIQIMNRWLSLRLELMGGFIVFASALFVSVVMPRNAGLAGLAITSALNLTGVMNWMVRQSTELEVNMNSVERLTEYNVLDEEAPDVTDVRPPKNWPTKGCIEVQDLYVKYRPELEPVLKGLTFSVRECEKIGVCGRTGCGKSTLMMTLYRIIEPTSGRIVIDGIDTSQIGVYDLRSRLSLVPQDPVIFSGTIRSNLDPWGDAGGDSVIWSALHRAGMDVFVKELEEGLDAPIKEGGNNLSTGQRQLLCMARALLRASPILILDEATSNVDNGTDSLIQTTIRSAFKDCTVLTIAHRLHTIVDSDRILVLDAGHLKEFDSPKELLKREDSAFRKLVEETIAGGSMESSLVTSLGLDVALALGSSATKAAAL